MAAAGSSRRRGRGPRRGAGRLAALVFSGAARIAAAALGLAVIAGGAAALGGCRKAPDLRGYCRQKCACGCDVEACVQTETARRDRLRTSESCSRAVDEMTACEIEHGACEKKLDGSISYQSPACGELVAALAACEKRP